MELRRGRTCNVNREPKSTTVQRAVLLIWVENAQGSWTEPTRTKLVQLAAACPPEGVCMQGVCESAS